MKFRVFEKLAGAFLICMAVAGNAQTNRIDIVRHDAPELANFGEHQIGVRTLTLTDRMRPDVLNTQAGSETAYYDRNLVIEVWYPAAPGTAHKSGTAYATPTRNVAVTAALHGRAVRDAAAIEVPAPLPLIIISHGYPGNRYLMSHAGENLASKGYVVASIDHTDSTYLDQKAFASTLYNRPLDQVFVLQQLSDLSANPESFLYKRVDADRTGIIGYSMGGYGLVINMGGGVSDALISNDAAPANDLVGRYAAANAEFRRNLDPRIKAGIAVAPWGMARGVWRATDLQEIRVPALYISGSQDLTAGYEDGTRAIFENAVNSDRYLLTYLNAGHSAAAPIPLPVELQNSSDQTGASHYTDPVWDSVRMNNIMNHFATAFFDYHLKDMDERRRFLDVIEKADDGVYAVQDGLETDAHTYWKGFEERTARGLLLEHRGSGE